MDPWANLNPMTPPRSTQYEPHRPGSALLRIMRGALMHNCGMSLGARVLVGRLGGAGKRKQSSPVLAGSRVYSTSRALALFSGLLRSADHDLISYDRRCRTQLGVMHSCCLRNTYDTQTEQFMQRADG